MSRATKWIDQRWQPSAEWTDDDRIELASALLFLMQNDIYAERYGLPGRPNVTAIEHVFREPAASLEAVRSSALALLQMARAEHPNADG